MVSVRVNSRLDKAFRDGDRAFCEKCGYLTQSTSAKIDGYVLYKEYLDSEIEQWKAKREALMEMCERLIAHKQLQLKALKQSLIDLYEQGLIDSYLMGKNKAIEIRPNTLPSVTLLCSVEHPGFPSAYKRHEVRWIANKEAIIEDHNQGKDVSGFATVTLGQQVRFKNAPRSRKQKEE